MTTILDRFEQMFVQEPNCGCWLWVGVIDGRGYPTLHSHGHKMIKAHRFSYDLHYKEDVPSSVFVCHKCDIPSCVNPQHLFLGSHMDNMRDMMRKGRSVQGTKNGQSKLTPTQVIAIQTDTRPYPVIAMDYGICRSTVGSIKTGKRWVTATHRVEAVQ